MRVLLVGRDEELAPLLPERHAPAARSSCSTPRDVIAMDDEPLACGAQAEGLVDRACASRPCATGVADAMVSAGNTGAVTTAAALLRIGRFKGVPSPAIAVAAPGARVTHPQLLVDAGAVVDPAPEWLVQYALMGREYARVRWDIDEPTRRAPVER